MNKNEAMDQLSKMLKTYDWFYEIGLDQYNRIVVYSHRIGQDIYKLVPDNFEGHQVLLHFATSKTATREQFVSMPNKPGSSLTRYHIPNPPNNEEFYLEAQARRADADGTIEPTVDELVGQADEEKSLRHLQNELERLEKVCGSFTLQEIFYEIQDGKNAVTNMSVRHPDVRKGLEKLFDQYGFDVIYEELDG